MMMSESSYKQLKFELGEKGIALVSKFRQQLQNAIPYATVTFLYWDFEMRCAVFDVRVINPIRVYGRRVSIAFELLLDDEIVWLSALNHIRRDIAALSVAPPRGVTFGDI